MRNIFQSTLYTIFVIITFIALAMAFSKYENPFDLYEHPLVWIALIGFVIVLVLKEVVNNLSISKAERLLMEKQGINPDEIDQWAWAKKIIKKWTKSKDLEESNEIVLDHNYDGIRELDNVLPPWWVYLFYATIIFAGVYLARYHVFGGDTQHESYAKQMALAKQELEQFQAKNPSTFDISKLAVLTDEASLTRGKAVFNLNCVACHAADGGGGIGPNLVDKNWILGGGIKNIFNTIAKGGRSGKGMVAWESTLKPEDIQKVSSYILSLEGTTPANPKAPEGDVWVDETAKKDEAEQATENNADSATATVTEEATTTTETTK